MTKTTSPSSKKSNNCNTILINMVTIVCDEREFYLNFIRHVNLTVDKSIRLTEMEAKVLCEFWMYKTPDVKPYRFNTIVRQEVANTLGLSTINDVNNYVKSLTDKGVLYKNKLDVLCIKEKFDLPDLVNSDNNYELNCVMQHSYKIVKDKNNES